VYGLPLQELAAAAQRRQVVLGGCVLTAHDPAWDCADCSRRFGNRETPYTVVPRSRAQWLVLVRTMLPAPVCSNAAGELLGGDPPLVIVRVTDDEIRILQARWKWQGAHTPSCTGLPFARVPLRTSAARVAELIAHAWAKRLAEYRWCPRCQRRTEPEHMLESLCHGCAQRALGVVF
jgi:hypothetical protein